MNNPLVRPDGTLHPAVKGAGWVVVGALAMSLVMPFEGLATRPYVDRIGTGQPVTWCYGETKAAGHPVPSMSTVFTKAQCADLLEADLQKVDVDVQSCIHVKMTPHMEAGLVSFVFNLGKGALCGGSVARLLNAGNTVGGCNAIMAYDHARGVVVQGLLRRRSTERQWCLRKD